MVRLGPAPSVRVLLKSVGVLLKSFGVLLKSFGVLLKSSGVLRKSARVLLKSASSPGLPLLRPLLQQHERPADERSEGRERRALGPTKNHNARRGDVRRQDRRADRRQVPEVA